ncbi:MAG: heme ABC transporter permease [Proteobacteria bacterium]|nr:heme ABC transporter permease [Pseudomonadota bacterium]
MQVQYGFKETQEGKRRLSFSVFRDILLSWHVLARPRTFLNVSTVVLPITFTLTALLFAMGLYLSLVASPADYQQGEAVRIMYVHVPASWMALMVYAFLALMSFFALIWRHPLAEILAISATPIGIVFTSLSLLTGSLWGKPMWGTFWEWDARLTSVSMLLLLYALYWFLYKAYSRRVASYLALVGVFNLPIVKGSVEWWNTLHQPASVTKLGAPSLHSTMLTPLVVMAAAYFFYFVSVLILRVQTELRSRKGKRYREADPNIIPVTPLVIPAKAGIQPSLFLDPRLRGDDTRGWMAKGTKS